MHLHAETVLNIQGTIHLVLLVSMRLLSENIYTVHAPFLLSARKATRKGGGEKQPEECCFHFFLILGSEIQLFVFKP